MNKDEFHIPFIKSLAVVAVVTVFAMVSSRYIVNYYMDHLNFNNKNTVYTSQESQK